MGRYIAQKLIKWYVKLVSCYKPLIYFFQLLLEKPAILCATGLDVGFLVDSSQYKKEDFLAVKALVRKIVSGFSYNATGPRAGLVSFSDRAFLDVPFIDYKNPSTFITSVDKLSQVGRTRQIGEGIKVAFNDLFGERTGARRNTPRLLVLITTGTQTKDERSLLPAFAAESFHELNQKILAVGIGPNVDKEELLLITKDKNMVKIFKDVKELEKKEIWQNLTLRACYGAGKWN